MAIKILITNDDGINAEGLKILVDKAKEYGEVVVVAPMQEQSAKSHALTLRKEVSVKTETLFEGIVAYSIDSTPADCVRYAYFGLKYDFDILFSGINKGYNIGLDIMYSGTVAAAFEASSLGKKAIAFSTGIDTFNGAINNFNEVMDYINDNDLLKEWNLYNVNFPYECKGIRITRQGGPIFTTEFVKKGDSVIQTGEMHFENREEYMHLDTSCISNNYISISPLMHERTKIEVFEKFRKNIEIFDNNFENNKEHIKLFEERKKHKVECIKRQKKTNLSFKQLFNDNKNK